MMRYINLRFTYLVTYVGVWSTDYNCSDLAAICCKRKGSLFIAYYELLTSRRSGMARVNEESHSFTCHPYVYSQLE